ncbi:MAG: hypothetical protein Tsb0021_06320 [Chlamydiales bacterium]
MSNILFFGPRLTGFSFLDTKNMTVVGTGKDGAFIERKDIPNQRFKVIAYNHTITEVENGEKRARTHLLRDTDDGAETFGTEVAGEINLINGCTAGGGAYKIYQLMKKNGHYIFSGSSKTYLSSGYLLNRVNRQIKNCSDPNCNHLEVELRNSIHDANTHQFVLFSSNGKIHFKLRSPKTTYLKSVKNLNLDEYWKTSLTQNKDHFLKVISWEGKYKEEILNIVKNILLDEIEQQSGKTHQAYLNEALVVASSIKIHEKIDGKRTNNLLKVGDVERVKLLLEKGAQINASVHEGKTVIFDVAVNGNKEILSFLVDNEADVNKVANDGTNPLIYASENGHVDCVTMLLPLVKNINHQDNYGLTAAHAAAREGHLDIIVLLKDHGLNLDIEDHEGRTPWFTLVENGHIKHLKVKDPHQTYLKKSKLNGRTALHFAANEGKSESVQWLIEKGADLNAIDERNKYSPLHYAVLSTNRETVSLLLEAGAATDNLGSDGYGPLHLACAMGLEEIATYLIDKKADINIQSAQGYTPLHIAAATGNVALVKKLLEKGADKNTVAADHSTPLSDAKENGFSEIIKLLAD